MSRPHPSKGPPDGEPDVPAAVARLLAWYRRARRPLPWRRSRDPYRVWVSEIMLQQTQVETVLPYFERFVRRFPDVSALAGAELEEVLKLWEGLGYYARARNLHRAARIVASEGWPKSAQGLSGLAGIGRSTAGAIASIAFSEPAPVLDGNVKRVWARLAAIDHPLAGRALAALWELSSRAVRCGDPGAVNQALMELGAMVCTPKRPACPRCPVRDLCLARRQGKPEAYPVRVPRRPKKRLNVSVAILWSGRRFLVQRRPEGGLLGGLWELPGGKWEQGESGEAALRRELREELGLSVRILAAHPPIRHAYTHFEVTLHPFECRAAGRPPRPLKGLLRWIRRGEIPSLPFPAGTHKVFRAVFGPDHAGETREGKPSGKQALEP